MESNFITTLNGRQVFVTYTFDGLFEEYLLVGVYYQEAEISWLMTDEQAEDLKSEIIKREMQKGDEIEDIH